MNYQDVLDRLSKNEPLGNQSRNSYASNREAPTRNALTARCSESFGRNTEVSYRPQQLTDRFASKSGYQQSPGDKSGVGNSRPSYNYSPLKPLTINGRTSCLSSLGTAKSPEVNKVNVSSGEINSQRGGHPQRSSCLDMTKEQTITNIINKYSSPAKRNTYDQKNAIKAFGYEHSTFSHLSTFERDKEDSEKNSSESYQSGAEGLRESVLQNHKHLFRKDQSRGLSRESSRSSGCL